MFKLGDKVVVIHPRTLTKLSGTVLDCRSAISLQISWLERRVIWVNTVARKNCKLVSRKKKA